jgi:hypothetical protein
LYSAVVRRWVLAAVVLALVTISVLALAAVHHADTGWYAPVFFDDGRRVIVVRRDVSAWVVGLGYEFFTPPAHVRLTADRFSIWQIDLASNRAHEIARFATSPAAGSWFEAYRPRLFGSATADVQPSGDSLLVTVGLTRHSTPASDSWIAKGVLTSSEAGLEHWRPGSAPPAVPGPPTLRESLEVVAVPGAAMPCGVALIDAASGSVRPLVMSAQCERRYGTALAMADVAPASHRARIERSQMLERTYADLVRQHVQRGEPDAAARLGAIRDMRRLGHYPPVPQLTARLLDDREISTRTKAGTLSPLFTIGDEEFAVGLFPDLERALDEPGMAVEKHIGRYIVHERFETSRALNAFLAAAGREFFVARGGRVYSVVLDMGTP